MKRGSGFFGSIEKVSSLNEGLREYMLGVYNYMTVSLLLSAVIAYFTAKTGLAIAIFSSPLSIVFMLAPIGLSLYLATHFHSMSFSSVRNFLFLYASLMGISLSTVFIAFRFDEIAKAFFITSSMFAGMSIYGYTTKKDLSSFGSIMIMAIWGIILASLVNLFMHSSVMSFAISIISVVVFSGMVAFDTQKLRRLYYASNYVPDSIMSKLAVMGAMQLYIDFVNIFIHMLHLLRLGRDE